MNGTLKNKAFSVKSSLKRGCLSLTGIKQFIRMKNKNSSEMIASFNYTD